MTVQQSWLQPHEGVTAKDRPDDPVLTMTPATKKVLAVVVHGLHRAALFGDRAPRNRELYERMTHPQVGDHVVVSDILSCWMAPDPDLDNFWKGVGLFLGDRTEWWTTNEQWELDKVEDGGVTDSDRSTDHAWYVQYTEDHRSICRWVNCELLAIPEGCTGDW